MLKYIIKYQRLYKICIAITTKLSMKKYLKFIWYLLYEIFGKDLSINIEPRRPNDCFGYVEQVSLMLH